MSMRMLVNFAMVVVPALGVTLPVRADVVRFRYRPVDTCGKMALVKSSGGVTGRWRPWALGIRTANYFCEPKATHVVTFSHPCNGRPAQVPIRFPSGTPRIAYQASAIVYSYGTYTIRVEFLENGNVDVVYNSGAFRSIE
ncbi:MAG: hypothetical protein ACFCD0_24675 [Gemmataceae bacterium]